MPGHQDSSNAIHVLEALYALEQPRTGWFRGVLNAAAAALDPGAGVGMVLYDVSSGAPRVEAIDGVNLAANGPEIGSAIHAQSEFAEDIVHAYRTTTCATLDEFVRNPAQNRSMRETYASVGVADQVMINGVNHSGLGAALCLFSRVPIRLSVSEREQMARISTHLSTAYRLLRRLEAPDAEEVGTLEAVLKVDGGLEHAAKAASSREARGSLAEAVRQREWARTRKAGSTSERQTAAWRPLVTGRWSLVDRYERDGRRYVVARENAPSPKGPKTLSARERQVAALAGIGRSNKLIAYELGLAHSTIRVLLARAAAKLGARSRSEMIDKFRECA